MNRAQTMLTEEVCRKLRFPLAILEVQKNHGFHVLDCELIEPAAVRPTTLERRLREALQADSPIYVQRAGNIVKIGIPREPPTAVNFASTMRAFKGPGISFPAGVNMFDQVRGGNLCVDSHMLITGGSGTGKSTFTRGLMRALSLTSRNRVRIAAIDEAKPNSFKYIPSDMLWGVGDRPATAERLLARAQDEINQRLEQTPARYAYHLIVVVDELKSLAKKRPSILARLENFVKVAREGWGHLIVISQSPDDVPDLILDELTCRAVFHLNSERASRRALGHTMATGLRVAEMFFQWGGKQELLRALSLQRRQKVVPGSGHASRSG